MVSVASGNVAGKMQLVLLPVRRITEVTRIILNTQSVALAAAVAMNLAAAAVLAAAVAMNLAAAAVLAAAVAMNLAAAAVLAAAVAMNLAAAAVLVVVLDVSFKR